ncbi:DUF3489 domain-containing protein [Devosia sp. A369]
MPKPLTDTQRVILAHAGSRDDRRVLPAPKTLNKNAGAIALSLRATLASGLIDEILAGTGDVAWGRTEGGEPTTLVINAFGLASIGVSDTEGTNHSATLSLTYSATPPRPGSKLALLVDRLSHADGATIDDLVVATGWQKHSVRGAMSGALKTRRRLEVTSQLVDGKGRVYRILAAASPKIDTDISNVTADSDQR